MIQERPDWRGGPLFELQNKRFFVQDQGEFFDHTGSECILVFNGDGFCHLSPPCADTVSYGAMLVKTRVSLQYCVHQLFTYEEEKLKARGGTAHIFPGHGDYCAVGELVEK
jgi:hypothetical protein